MDTLRSVSQCGLAGPVFDIIFRCFEKGEDVKLVGFGHFRIRRKASRRGRNRVDTVSVVVPDAAEKLYYRIGEVEQITEVPTYVLRDWESESKLSHPRARLRGAHPHRGRPAR
jgi:hypothetical protein